jgi:lysophospholipase L1-like esterase
MKALRRIIAGLLVAVALLASAELLARLLLRGRLADYHSTLKVIHDNLHNFHVPLFVETSPGRFETNPELSTRAEYQSFAMPKPPGTFRIFFVGESSVAAWPYDWRSKKSFSSQLQERLRERGDSRVEVINAGLGGATSTIIRDIVDSLLQFSPDMVIMYAGHNEFGYYFWSPEALDIPPFVYRTVHLLDELYIYRLLLRLTGRGMLVKPQLEHDSPRAGSIWKQYEVRDGQVIVPKPAIPDRRWERFVRNELFLCESVYRDNLRAIAGRLSQSGVRLVVGTLVSNLADFAPVFSFHSSGLSAADLERWNRLHADWQSPEVLSDDDKVISVLTELLTIDPEYAETHFELARVYIRHGRFREAQEHAIRARDLSPAYASSQRAPSSLSRLIRSEASALGLPVVDFERQFLSMPSNHGIPGKDLFLDSLHPNETAHARMAEELERTLTSLRLIP